MNIAVILFSISIFTVVGLTATGLWSGPQLGDTSATGQPPVARASAAKPEDGISLVKARDAVAANVSVTPPSSKSNSVSPRAKNPLDVFIETTQANGGTVIDRYSITDHILYIELNETAWNSFDKEHQHRLCELLAQTGFIDSMSVPVAYLTLDNGMTTVGNISHGSFGPQCQFNPNEDYWNFK